MQAVGCPYLLSLRAVPCITKALHAKSRPRCAAASSCAARARLDIIVKVLANYQTGRALYRTSAASISRSHLGEYSTGMASILAASTRSTATVQE